MPFPFRRLRSPVMCKWRVRRSLSGIFASTVVWICFCRPGRSRKKMRKSGSVTTGRFSDGLGNRLMGVVDSGGQKQGSLWIAVLAHTWDLPVCHLKPLYNSSLTNHLDKPEQSSSAGVLFVCLGVIRRPSVIHLHVRRCEPIRL